MQAALVLMSRAPILGESNQRLKSHLKAEEYLELQRAFLKDINANFINLKKSYSRLDLYLAYPPQVDKNVFADLIDSDFKRISQRGKDLGEKIYNAAFDAYQKSNLPVIITDSNLPLLEVDIFTEALAGLKERDLVIGPAEAGGCYLFGMNKPEEFLFDFKSWDDYSSLDKAITAASQHNLKMHFLPESFLVDSFKELLKLRSKLLKKDNYSNYPVNTRRILEKIFTINSN